MLNLRLRTVGVTTVLQPKKVLCNYKDLHTLTIALQEGFFPGKEDTRSASKDSMVLQFLSVTFQAYSFLDDGLVMSTVHYNGTLRYNKYIRAMQ